MGCSCGVSMTGGLEWQVSYEKAPTPDGEAGHNLLFLTSNCSWCSGARHRHRWQGRIKHYLGGSSTILTWGSLWCAG
jgi:hypothetical protein